MPLKKRLKDTRVQISVVVAIVFIIIVSIIIIYVPQVQPKLECNPGERQCQGNNLFTCTADGTWGLYNSCGNKLCVIDHCEVNNQVCSPNQLNCLGNDLAKCNDQGSNYDILDYCSRDGGTCTGYKCVSPELCFVGDTRCSNNVVQICTNNSVTTSWVDSEYCKDLCNNGQCTSIPTLDPLSGYTSARKLAGISDVYINETKDYDYTNVYKIDKITQLRDSFNGKDVKQIVESIAQFTYNNLMYNATLDYYKQCNTEPASQIVRDGWGVCSSMSKVNIALLRGMGIASRAVTGCIKPKISCATASVITAGTVARVRPRFTPSKVVGNRTVTAGFAHAWIEVWLPTIGWTLLESTNGLLYQDDCTDYDTYATEDNYDKNIDICSYENSVYGSKCASF